MLIPFIINRSFWNHSIWGMAMREGLERELRRKRCEGVYIIGNENPIEDFAGIDLNEYFKNGTPHIVVVIGTSKTWLRRVYDYLNQRGIEVLLICNQPPPELMARGVIKTDYRAGVEILMRHFSDCGCTKTALYGYFMDSSTDESKLKYYREFAQNEAVFYNSDNLDTCYNQFITCVDKFDSVLCVNDIAALSLVNHLKRDNIPIPERLQIACFSTSKLPEMYKPSITSLVMAYEVIGQQAVSSFAYLAKCDWRARICVDISGELVVRESTCPLNKVESRPVKPDTNSSRNSFFKDDEVTDFSNLNRLVESCDKYDLEIISRCLDGQSTERIASELSFSQESIRYRIRCLAKVLGYDNKAGLIEYLRNNHFRSAIWDE